MNPAYSVIFFTVASGAGFGLLALLGLVGFAHGPASSFAFGLTVLAGALALVTAGLLSSTFHLGHPERAWRALSQWRSSWLSREGVVALATYVPALIFAALWLGLVPGTGWTGAVGLVLAAMCAAAVACTAMIYASLKTIRQWRHRLTVPVYLAFALATGAPLLMVIAAAFGRFQPAQAIMALLAFLTAGGLKFAYWRGIDSAPRTLTMAAATGLAGQGGTVRQWETPHTARNFVMTEMGFAVARRHVLKLRNLVYAALLSGAAAVILALLLPAAASVFALVAALGGLAAAFVERWLFFAEAQHTVTLYYGANSA